MGIWGVGWGGGSHGIWEGSESCSAGKAKPGEGGGGGRTWGWERLKPKLLLRRFSTVKPLPLGESSWLELPRSLDVGQRVSLQPPVLSYTQCGVMVGAPAATHWLRFWGWILGLALWSSDLLHQVKIAVQVPTMADLVFVLSMLSLEALLPSWPKAKHHIPVWRAHRRASASEPLSLLKTDI